MTQEDKILDAEYLARVAKLELEDIERFGTEDYSEEYRLGLRCLSRRLVQYGNKDIDLVFITEMIEEVFEGIGFEDKKIEIIKDEVTYFFNDIS